MSGAGHSLNIPSLHPLVTRSLPSSGEARSLRDDTTGEGTDEGNERDMEEEIIGNRWKELDYVDRKPRKSDNRWTLFSLGSYARLFVLPFGSSFVIPSRRASPVRACNEGNPRDTTVGRG